MSLCKFQKHEKLSEKVATRKAVAALYAARHFFVAAMSREKSDLKSALNPCTFAWPSLKVPSIVLTKQIFKVVAYFRLLKLLYKQTALRGYPSRVLLGMHYDCIYYIIIVFLLL